MKVTITFLKIGLIVDFLYIKSMNKVIVLMPQRITKVKPTNSDSKKSIPIPINRNNGPENRKSIHLNRFSPEVFMRFGNIIYKKPDIKLNKKSDLFVLNFNHYQYVDSINFLKFTIIIRY